VLERQFRRYFREALRHRGLTGANLLQTLERRLDNVVFRLGFAESRAQARQLVSHGHFQVNGHKTDIPSFLVSAGDEISVRETSRNLTYFKDLSGHLKRVAVPEWMILDAPALSGRILALPSRDQIDAPIQEQLVVEYYSR